MARREMSRTEVRAKLIAAAERGTVAAQRAMNAVGNARKAALRTQKLVDQMRVMGGMDYPLLSDMTCMMEQLSKSIGPVADAFVCAVALRNRLRNV